MKDSFSLLWPWFSRIAIILTLIWAAQAEHKLLWVYVLIGFFVLVDLIRRGSIRFRRWRSFILDYPRRIEKEVELIRQNEELVLQISTSKKLASKAREEGILIGVGEVYGELLARGTIPPEIQFICEYKETVDFMGQGDNSKIYPQARYFVKDIPSGAIRGVVEVVDINDEDKSVRLRCVEATTQEFWEKLADRARESENHPPLGVRLEPFSRRGPSSSEKLNQEISENLSARSEEKDE